VCRQALVPRDVRAERDWRCFEVAGPLDFALTGVVASLSATIADARISIFVVSTFDTDYLLVKAKDAQAAAQALSAAGHELRGL
jgi:hypothetical protein